MASSTPEEDVVLVQRVLTGQRSAFRSLVERYQNYVFSVALQVIKNREVAEEIAQDVFIKVYNQLGSFEQRSRFSTWLYTIAYRTSLDYARRKRLKTNSIDQEDSALQLPDEAAASPSGQLDQADLNDQLKAVLDELKPADALLISLYYFRERSVSEISEITGLTPSNIKTKLFRLREQLRDLLSQKLKEEIEDLL